MQEIRAKVKDDIIPSVSTGRVTNPFRLVFEKVTPTNSGSQKARTASGEYPCKAVLLK